MADLKVTITEALKLQGNNQGATHTKTISGINEASRRVVNVRTHADATELIKTAAADGAGTFKTDNIKYIRVTNLDSSNYVLLSLEASGHFAQVKIEAGKSFMMGTANGFDNVDTSSNFSSYSAVDITTLKAQANTAAVDLEVFIATA